MTLQTTTHVNFRGTARDALAHYQSVFGGELMAMTYADMGNVEDPAEADQIVFGQVVADNGFRIMAYDVPASRQWSHGDQPFYVSVRSADPEEITTVWEKLVAGATIVQPLAPSGWAPLYGMLTDPYGVTWVLDVVPQ